MKLATLLDLYLEERTQLLRTISELLERDPGVKAAWLIGSLGRGDADALSDIDIWVIVDDKPVDNSIVQLREYTSRVGNPVLFLEAPQNAPEGGAYLMTCYDAPVAPHIVDWYGQPQSLAYIPGQVRLLFNRGGLLHMDQPIRFSEQASVKDIIQRPIDFISFFWMMLMITAKQACRSPWSEEMNLLPHLINSIAKAQRFLGQDNILLPRNMPPYRSPGEKIQLLHELADQMRKMMASISEQGEEVPELITPGAYHYLKLIEECAQMN